LQTTTAAKFSHFGFFLFTQAYISLLISWRLPHYRTIIPRKTAPEYVASISPLSCRSIPSSVFRHVPQHVVHRAPVCFSLNLVCCSVKRLPHVFKFISEPPWCWERVCAKFFPEAGASFSAPLDRARALAEFSQGVRYRSSPSRGGIPSLCPEERLVPLGVYVVT